MKGGHVVIMGGEKPLFPSTGPTGHAALGNILEQKGFDYEPCHGKYQGDRQPSYIIHVRSDGEDEVLKGIAKRMGQESIVHSEGGKHQLVFLNGENAGKATAPADGVNWFGDQEPDDNYTTLYGASGEPVGHFSYNMDFDQDMVPDGPGPMVDVPEAAKQVLKSAVESYRGILLDLRKREDDRLGKVAGTMNDPSREGSQVNTAGPMKTPTWKPMGTAMKSSIDGRVAKYMTEGGRQSKVRGRKPSDDVSTQGVRGPSSPHSTNVVASAAKTHKSETPMKLHDLMKSQATLHKAQCSCGQPGCKWCGKGDIKKTIGGTNPAAQHAGHGAAAPVAFPPTNRFANKLAGTKPSNEQGEHGGSAQSSAAFNAPQRQGPGPSSVAKSGVGLDKSFVAGGRLKPSAGDPRFKPSGADSHKPAPPQKPVNEDEWYKQGEKPVVKNSIFKKMPDMNKAQTIAHATAKRNGGTIRLGKQEFYIDHQNPTAPQKDDPSSSIPGGKETGWRNGGDKPKSIEHSASGGAISANKPKPGPDQKNTSENSITEGAVPKSSGKNDLIEKAAADFHKRTGGRFQKPKKEREESSRENTRPDPEQSRLDEGRYDPQAFEKREETTEETRPEPRDAGDDEGRHNPMDFEKATAPMGAPKAPSAGGAGSPTLSGGAPSKPPTAHASANPKAFGKALTPFSAQHQGQAAAVASQQPLATPAAPKATPKPPDAYDASLFQPPAGGAPSGLDLAGSAQSVRGGFPTLPGVGVTPRPAAPAGLRSPAAHQGIRGFLGKGALDMGKMCKACGKSHGLGKCG